MNVYELIEMLSNLTDEEKAMPVVYDYTDMDYFTNYTYKIVLKNM